MKKNRIVIIIIVMFFCICTCIGNYAYATEISDENIVVEDTTENPGTEEEITEENEDVMNSEEETPVEEEIEKDTDTTIEYNDSSENYEEEDLQESQNYIDGYNEYTNDASDYYNNSSEIELTYAQLNTDLESVLISEGMLAPKFEETTYKYTIYFKDENQVENLKVDFKARSAYVQIDHKMGKDNFYIYLENSRGEYSLYNFYYHIIKDNELLIGNSLYTISDFDSKNEIPLGFNLETKKINGVNVKFLNSSDGFLKIVQYESVDNKNDIKWFYLANDLKKLDECKTVKVAKTDYIKVLGEKGIIYGQGKEGLGYYKYNSKTKKIVKFIGVDIEKYKKSQVTRKIIIFVIGLSLITLTVLVVIKKVRKTKKTKKIRPYLSIEE